MLAELSIEPFPFNFKRETIAGMIFHLNGDLCTYVYGELFYQDLSFRPQNEFSI